MAPVKVETISKNNISDVFSMKRDLQLMDSHDKGDAAYLILAG